MGGERRTRRILIFFATMALVATACGGNETTQDRGETEASGDKAATTASPPDETASDSSGDEDGSPTPLTYFRSVPFDAGGAYYYIAQDKGYFDEAGVDADVVTGRGGAGTAIAALVTGSVEIAQGGVDSYLNAVAEGADVVAFWNLLEPGVFGVMLDTSVAPTIADLKGKKIGVIGPASSTLSVLEVMLAQEGMSADDVEIVSLGCCTAQYTALKDGSVAAIGTWDVQVDQIKATAQSEEETDFLDRIEYLPSELFLGDILVAHRDYLNDHAEDLAGFMNAMKRGIDDMTSDPQAALETSANHIDGMDPTDPAQRTILDLRIDTTVPDGMFDYDLLPEALSAYIDAGLTEIDPAVVNVETLFSNTVPEMVASME